VTPPISLLQTAEYKLSKAGDVDINPLSISQNLPLRRVETLDDFQKIEVSASPQETLLFLSQQYHRAWRAGSHNRLLRTVIVNRFYQGVVLPPNTSEVELFFRPFVLWSWLPQLLFAASGVLLLFGSALQMRGGNAALD
jgi:hypothetical protein